MSGCLQGADSGSALPPAGLHHSWWFEADLESASAPSEPALPVYKRSELAAQRRNLSLARHGARKSNPLGSAVLLQLQIKVGRWSQQASGTLGGGGGVRETNATLGQMRCFMFMKGL